MKILGRLSYRTSYGQNVLKHTLEVVHLAGITVAEVGANVKVTKRAALLHDLGKAMTHEVEGSHASISAQLAPGTARPSRNASDSRIRIRNIRFVLMPAISNSRSAVVRRAMASARVSAVGDHFGDHRIRSTPRPRRPRTTSTRTPGRCGSR